MTKDHREKSDAWQSGNDEKRSKAPSNFGRAERRDALKKMRLAALLPPGEKIKLSQGLTCNQKVA